jgi:hypothetical protein
VTRHRWHLEDVVLIDASKGQAAAVTLYSLWLVTMNDDGDEKGRHPVDIGRWASSKLASKKLFSFFKLVTFSLFFF